MIFSFSKFRESTYLKKFLKRIESYIFETNFSAHKKETSKKKSKFCYHPTQFSHHDRGDKGPSLVLSTYALTAGTILFKKSGFSNYTPVTCANVKHYVSWEEGRTTF